MIFKIYFKGCLNDCNHEKVKKNPRDSLIFIREYLLTQCEDRIAFMFHRMIVAEMCSQISKRFKPDEIYRNYFEIVSLTRSKISNITYLDLQFY